MLEYSGSTVLVTGATGLIGSNLVRALMKIENVRVIAMGRSYQKIVKCFQQYVGQKNFLIVAHDICQPFTITEPIHYIFHAAGPIGGGVIKKFPLQVIAPNLLGLHNCLDFLYRQKMSLGMQGKIIVFSSATVYGSQNQEHRIVSEEDTQLAETLDAKVAAYSESKRMAEVLALSYARQYDLNVVIARFSYVYGYSFYEPETAFYKIINQVIQGRNITIMDPNQKMLDYIFVEDAVEGVLVVGGKGNSGEVYNISSNGELSNYISFDQMVQHILEVANVLELNGQAVKLCLPPQGIFRNSGLRLKNNKLKALGWMVTTSPEEGILKVIHYKLRNSNLF